MLCFTIQNGAVSAGISTKTIEAQSGDTYQAISLGERGRGRYEAVIPVRNCGSDEVVMCAEVTETRAGKPAVIADEHTETDFALVAFRTQIGFRGGNDHTGCRTSAERNQQGRFEFRPFPGKILATGTIAQGTAGNMGSGDQLLAIVPKNVWVRAAISGRLYGANPPNYFYFDGLNIKAYTVEDAENLGYDLSIPEPTKE
jgi:hypothetical protein